tara:strand:+ start:1584 stop:2798 length:1215 start_codon:yes stop_codon:yes gene_type:complete
MQSETSRTLPIVFICTISVVIFSLVSIIFPALIISVIDPLTDLNSFELGAFAIPFLVISIIIFSIGILYKQNKLSKNIKNRINFILDFEISKKNTIIIAIIILSIYIGFTVPELLIDESKQIPDYWVFEQAYEIWPFGQYEEDIPNVEEQNDRYVKMIFLIFSLEILQNVKIIPFLFSILVVVITYFITRELSQKRFAGIISMIVILQSYTFLRYDTIAIYDNFWTFFYLLSVYLIIKKWYLSSVSYILSIFSKAFSLTFLPMSLFIIFKSKITIRKKILTCITYVGMLVTIITIWKVDETLYPKILEIDTNGFWIGFTKWSYQMQLDLFLIFSILPLVIILYYKAKQKIFGAEIVMFLILGALSVGPFVELFTTFYTTFPYRFVPLIAFFAIGIGIIFTKKTN